MMIIVEDELGPADGRAMQMDLNGGRPYSMIFDAVLIFVCK